MKEIGLFLHKLRLNQEAKFREMVSYYLERSADEADYKQCECEHSKQEDEINEKA